MHGETVKYLFSCCHQRWCWFMHDSNTWHTSSL